MKTEQTPYELTLDLISKSGVDIHQASISKHCAVIEMSKFECESDIKKVIKAFIDRWGHAYKYDNHCHNNALGCTMIYFNSK